MSVASSISAAMDADASKKERHKAFQELQFHSSALVNFTVQLKQLEDHFNELEKLMQKRFEELGRKGTENEKEKKSAAEKSTVNSNIEKEKKFAAEKSTGMPNKTSEENSAAEKSTGNPNKTSEKKSAAEKSTENPNKTSEKKSVEEKSSGNPNKTSPALKDDVKPRPQLKSLCEKMDSEGLKKFLVDSRSDIATIRNEAPAALRCAADPAKLVLQTLEGFYPADNGRELFTDLAGQRYGCHLLLESLPFVLSPDEVSSEAKKDARKIAAVWKSKHNVDAESKFMSVEALTFLQLLASYGISKEFEEDDLSELVVHISGRPKVHELCRTLQISHRIPDVVEKLRSSRKNLDAVNFVYAFGLVEKFPPVTLLKAYLEDEKKVSQEIAQKGRYPNAQYEATAREIASLNTVIKLIKVHKLESQMSIKDLQSQVGQLERARSEKKRQAKAIKSQTKRARLSSVAGVASGAGAVVGALLPKPSPQSAFALSSSSAWLPKSTLPSSFAISNSSDLYRPAPVASIPSYNLPGQSVYDRGSQGIYGSSYDVGSNPSPLSRSRLYPSDSLQSSLYGVGSFRGSTSDGTYNIGSGLPPATSQQSSYLH